MAGVFTDRRTVPRSISAARRPRQVYDGVRAAAHLDYHRPMPRQPSPLPPSLTRASFSTAEATASGVSRRRLRHPGLEAPFTGVRTPTGAAPHDDVVARVVALGCVLDERHAVAGLTALAVLGIGQPPRFRRHSTIYLAVSDQRARVRRHGVVTWVANPYGTVTQVRDLRVTAPPTTFLHLARMLTLEELIMVGDAMTRRQDPPTTLGLITAHVNGSPRCVGLRTAREALAHIRPGTDSVPETQLRRLIRNAGLPEPAVNQPAYGSDGQYLARPDLSYPELKIAIEYLGDVHRTDQRTWRSDIERHQRLRDAGWIVLEASADSVADPTSLLHRLRRAVAARS